MLFCAHKVKTKYIGRIIEILKSLMDVCMENLHNSIFLVLRIFFITENSEEYYDYILKFFELVDKKKKMIAEKCPDILAAIFLKCLRLLSITILYKECANLQKKLIKIVKFIWTENQPSKIRLSIILFSILRKQSIFSHLVYISYNLIHFFVYYV